MSVNAFWFVNGMGWGALLTLTLLLVTGWRKERRRSRGIQKMLRDIFPDDKTPPDGPASA